MRSHRTSCIARRIGIAWLLLSVHFDGFRADPRAFLIAATWWLLRKRVRARGQFAPLLSQSPRAYAIWVLREELGRQTHSSPDQTPPIIALVTVGAVEALSATLDSLAAEGLDAIIIASDESNCLAGAIAAIDWQREPWLLPMRAGDRLAPGAAAAYRTVMAETDAAVLYADDDLLDGEQQRTDPHFKPDWNSELYRQFDFLTGACIVRTGPESLADAAGHADWAARLVAQAVAAGGAHHVRAMLHHRAARPEAPRAATPLVIAADLPPVSIIIPTRNRLDLLRTCLDGVAATRYPDIELIVVDNDSDDPATLAYLAAQDPARVRVLRQPGPFNYSTMNNRAVVQARGQLLCLLNNDIEVMAPDWLAIMATQAQRDEVGAVGAQLLYPDGRIQHAGVVIGMGNAAGHAHRFVDPQAAGYFRRHALPQFTSAVTGACLVVAREKFLAVGGLDERNFAVAFNDVDLCLRLNQRGWQSLYEPRAVLIHHESVSRGHDRDPAGAARFAEELAALQRICHTDSIVDPFHHPQLSRASEQFAVAL
ncbi:MAG: glycosyl transferase [Erythrobacter sp.]|nr:glycosyl transferase [Erythrobacter sp.]